MKRLLLLFCFLLVYGQVSSQSFIKTNPIRAFLGEVHLFYEYHMPNTRSAFELKLGYVYKLEGLNTFSSIDNQYGWAEYYDGLNNGLVFGLSHIYYGKKNKSFYLQSGFDTKFLRMNDVRIVLGAINTSFPYYTIVDANHFVLNPKLRIGFRNDNKILLSPYFGAGASMRFSKITNNKGCFHPDPIYCNQEFAPIATPSIAPSFHLGLLVGIRTRK